MKFSRPAATVAALLVVGGAHAQSLEASYANLCADGADAKSETCVALRKALLEKLAPASGQAPSAGATPGSAPGSHATAAPSSADVPAAWGAWAALADTHWTVANGPVWRYRWLEPGRVMIEDMIDLARETQRRFELDPDGRSLWVVFDGKRVPFIAAGDGVFHHGVGPELPNARTAYRVGTGTVRSEYQTLVGTEWHGHPAASATWTRIDTATAEAQLQQLAQRRREATNPATFPSRWGVYATLAGHTWEYKVFSGHVIRKTYRWLDPGLSMEVVTEQPGATPMRMVWTATTDGKVPLPLDASGAFHSENTGADGVTYISRTYSTGEGRYEESLTTRDASGKVTFSNRDKYVRSDVRQAQSAARSQLLGTLFVAGVGAAAVGAHGGDAAQILGGAMKGAEIANPGSPTAAALGATGMSLVAGGASGGGGAAAGTGSRASYPTKPNLATGACAGFTESNYRTKALEGGPDSQLLTMCGQAFEYYTMYKRAIAQGYSEADANRTYDAHEKSTAVASGYLRSHGAR